MSFYTLSSTRGHFSNTDLSDTRIMGPRDWVGLLSFFLATQAQLKYLFTKKMSGHRSLKFCLYITYTASKPRAHNVITIRNDIVSFWF